MTRRLLDFASTRKMKNGETPSDMMSLMDLQKKHKYIMIRRDDLAGVLAIPEGDQWTKEQCEQLTPAQKRAMHFSRFFMRRFWLPKHSRDTLQDRPVIAQKWLKDWLQNCGRQAYKES